MAGFTELRWQQINALLAANPKRFGMPVRRSDSVVIGSFNALKLGKDLASAKRWEFLARFIERFDLLAVQEVMDELAGIRRLLAMMDGGYRMVISDTTGAIPGQQGLRERLAFIYRPSRISFQELASDITFDRSAMATRLRVDIDVWKNFFDAIDDENTERAANGLPPKSLSKYAHPEFLNFIRTPYCASFTIKPKHGAAPVEFLAVNAHTLYGKSRDERNREFFAMFDWIVNRVKNDKNMYFKNMVLMADLNMQFSDPGIKRSEIIQRLIELESNLIAGEDSARANFPFLSVHPGEQSLFHTNARRTETFDHIAFFINRNERGLPLESQNPQAGQQGLNGYDYGVFNFTELFAQAMHDTSFDELTASQRSDLLKRTKADVSDHMPIWVRIPIPGS